MAGHDSLVTNAEIFSLSPRSMTESCSQNCSRSAGVVDLLTLNMERLRGTFFFNAMFPRLQAIRLCSLMLLIDSWPDSKILIRSRESLSFKEATYLCFLNLAAGNRKSSSMHDTFRSVCSGTSKKKKEFAKRRNAGIQPTILFFWIVKIGSSHVNNESINDDFRNRASFNWVS